MDSNIHTAGASAPSTQTGSLGPGWFPVGDDAEGSARLVGNVVVFNASGHLCATQARCPHQQTSLIEGHVTGLIVTCTWHGSQFDAGTGAVLRGQMARVETIQQQDAK